MSSYKVLFFLFVCCEMLSSVELIKRSVLNGNGKFETVSRWLYSLRVIRRRRGSTINIQGPEISGRREEMEDSTQSGRAYKLRTAALGIV